MHFKLMSLKEHVIILDSSRSPQVPPPRQCYSPGGVTIFGFTAVPLMPPLTQW